MLPPLAISFFPTTGNGLVDALPYLGIALIVLALMAFARKRRQRAAGGPTAREQIERSRQAQSVRGDLESLMVEIEQLARRMGAQLDAKSVQLERLIREADERLAQLERPRDLPPPTRASRASPTPVDEPPPPPTDPLTRSVHDLADQGLTPVAIAQKLDEHVGKVELILALRRA